MAVATLTSKGQVTIPKTVRDSLRLHTGDKIEIIVTDNREALLRPISKKVDDIFGKLHRSGRTAISTEEMDSIIRQKVSDQFQ